MYQTLVDIICDQKDRTKKGITFIEGGDSEEFVSYADLYNEALKYLAGLQSHGLMKGDEVVFQLDNNRDFIVLFWACLLGGYIPVPLTIGLNDEHKRKLFNVWRFLNNPYMVNIPSHSAKLESFASVNDLVAEYSKIAERTISIDLIASSTLAGDIIFSAEDDIAFIQFSSGSTGNPKGVVLTHRNLLVNMRDISTGGSYSENDTTLSWMPLTHDMGLIGFHLNPLLIGMNHCLIPTALFIRRPSIWLTKASEQKATVLCSPNFGYKYVLKHCSDTSRFDWDLSHVRLIYNGAEPISELLSREFLSLLSSKGLKKEAMCPVYGLAEASLAVTMSDLLEEVISYSVSRDHLNIGDKVIPTEDQSSVRFVNVGKPITNCKLKITDDANHDIENGTIGHVQIAGDNVTQGYYNNPKETDKIKNGEWLRTGDTGFIKDGCLYVVGRQKDIVFVNGQNYYPHDIERVAEEIQGIELNKIAVVGRYNQVKQTEEVVAFVFHRGAKEKFLPVLKALKSLINNRIGIELSEIIPVKDIPRTTSGKLQRFKLFERLNRGDYDEIRNEIAHLLTASMNSRAIAQPRNQEEELLLKLWRRVLNTNHIGIEDKFFDYGGNSLKAAELGMEIGKNFSVAITYEVLLKHQSVLEFAQIINDLTPVNYIPIPKQALQDEYNLTPSQEGIFKYSILNPESTTYNIPVAFELTGDVKYDQLERCIHELIRQTEALRFSFNKSPIPKYEVKAEYDFELQIEHCTVSEINATLQSLVQPFDISKPALMRSFVLEASNKKVLFLDFHHIASDGISVYNFVRHVWQLYSAQKPHWSSIDFSDYNIWAGQQGVNNNMLTNFWSKELSELPVLELPSDFSRPAELSGKGGRIPFEIDSDLFNRLTGMAARHNCTTHVLLLSVYFVLLKKYTGQNELIVGIPISGREHPDLLSLHGMFVNNLPVKVTIDDSISFSDFLKVANKKLNDVLEHRELPFSEMMKLVSSQRDVSRSPIFDTMFVYQNMGLPNVEDSKIDLKLHQFDPGFSKYDISLEVFEQNDSFNAHFEYSSDLFLPATIGCLKGYFNEILRQILNQPDDTIGALSMISKEEEQHLIHDFNNIKVSGDKPLCVHELFEVQTKSTPAQVAIEFDGKSTTYQELNAKANILAQKLKDKGVTPDTIVPVLLERSPEFIISVLAILKAGGAFLPLDIDLPKERIRFLIRDCRAELVVTTSYIWSLDYQPEGEELDVLLVNAGELSTQICENLCNANAPSDMAYVIYTSGTTGQPKGVMIEHKSLVNYILWASHNYIQGEETTFPLYTSVSFDLTITSIFAPLLTGNKIVVYGRSKASLPIEKVLLDNKADIIKLTPSHLRLINDKADALGLNKSRVKRLVVGGEELPTSLARQTREVFNKPIDIVNEYGPTEATVGCMIYRFDERDQTRTVPIGKPAANIGIYLLDVSLRPVPHGVHGELYISGSGLGRGYLYRPELTDDRFLDNPFLPGQKLYKTGDIARRLADGNIEFIGRKDNQVKINGYRIELSEIELTIEKHTDISKAIVITRTGEDCKPFIYAYYIAKYASSQELNELNIKRFVANHLPHYMVPLRFILINELPLTENGKIDYEQLPDPLQESLDQVAIEVSEKEKIAIEVWEEVLRDNNITLDSNFFEIGGDSIKALQISSRLQELGCSVLVKDILTYHTIRQISPYIDEELQTERYDQGLQQGEVALTPIMQWFKAQLFNNPGFYNQSVLLELTEEINPKVVKEAMHDLIKHHDTLRLNWYKQKECLVYNNDHVDELIAIEEYKIEDLTNVNDLIECLQQVKNGFDLENDLLIKTALINDGLKFTHIFFTAHHLLVDGISWRILLEDFYKSYKSKLIDAEIKLPAKTASLGQYSQFLNARLAEIEERSYWQNMVDENFIIPVDNEVSSWRVGETKELVQIMPRIKTNFLLKDAHSVYKTNMPILLNAALAMTLKEWTGLSSIVIEQENHGRHLNGSDISRSVGWFTAMYPLKFEVDEDQTDVSIKNVKEQILNVPNHGMGYGFIMYSDHSGLDVKPSMSEVRLNYLGQFDQELNNDLFKLSNLPHGAESHATNAMTTKLEFNLMVIDGELNISLTYNAKAHERATANKLIKDYISKINKIIEHISVQEDIHFTPSDFQDVALDEEELDALF